MSQMTRTNRRSVRRARPPRANPAYSIPQLIQNIQGNHTFRFSNISGSAVANVPINFYGLLCTCGTIATSSTAVSPLWNSVKVNSITLWGPQSAYGSDNTVAVEWDTGYVNTNNRTQMATTVSNAAPAYVKARPPGMSLTGFWLSYGGGSAVIAKITGPANMIMDINLSFLSSNDEPTSAPSFVVTGPATIGATYYLFPDYPTTNIFSPVGLVGLH